MAGNPASYVHQGSEGRDLVMFPCRMCRDATRQQQTREKDWQVCTSPDHIDAIHPRDKRKTRVIQAPPGKSLHRRYNLGKSLAWTYIHRHRRTAEWRSLIKCEIQPPIPPPPTPRVLRALYHRLSAPDPHFSFHLLPCHLYRQWHLRHRRNGFGFALVGLASPGCRVGTGGAWRTLKEAWMSDLTSISFHPSLRLPVMGGLREHLLGWAGRSWLRGEKRHRGGGGVRTDRRTQKLLDLTRWLFE